MQDIASEDVGRLDGLQLGLLMGLVFCAFISIGMALPVIGLQVHNTLHFGPAMVGLVTGCQFVASLASRLWAGRLADKHSPRLAVNAGLVLAVLGGLCYLVSACTEESRLFSVSSLLAGRTLLGGAESLIITGTMTWALQVVPKNRSAKTIAWVGMSMFAAMALGAPLGSAIFSHWHFWGVSIATLIAPVIAGALTMLVKDGKSYPKHAEETMSSFEVAKAVCMPGLGFALSGITFGAVTSFITLFFYVKHWEHGSIAFSAFALALIATRILCGHLPDRFGGAKTAAWSLVIQSVGLITLATASSPLIGILGALICGGGFSLVFPALALESIKRVPNTLRGSAMGIYNAFLDVALGFGSPVLGWLAGHLGLGSVFVVSAISAALAIPICVALQRRNGRI